MKTKNPRKKNASVLEQIQLEQRIVGSFFFGCGVGGDFSLGLGKQEQNVKHHCIVPSYNIGTLLAQKP